MMRKIMSEAEREAKDIRNKRIMGVVLGLIMLLSTAGYFVFDFSGTKTKSIDYAGIKFSQTTAGTWTFSYGGNSYETQYTPLETKNIQVTLTKTLSDYYNKPLYISANPIDYISQSSNSEILKNINTMILRASFACMDNNCNQNYPIKDCSQDNMIIFEQSSTNSSRISQNQKCVTLTYASGDEEKLADAFLFGIIGIK
jgi:hypothetical protein